MRTILERTPSLSASRYRYLIYLWKKGKKTKKKEGRDGTHRRYIYALT